MARNYYRILGLPSDASMGEIKRAYREKAKEYHPDRNDHPRAEEAFVLVNEAYVYLSDPVRRASLDRRRAANYSRARRQEEQARWKAHQQAEARARAKEHANDSFDEFAKSRIYRAAMVLNEVYNYVFILMGVLMILLPLADFIFGNEEAEDVRVTAIIFPALIGGAFIYGIWYFAIKQERTP